MRCCRHHDNEKGDSDYDVQGDAVHGPVDREDVLQTLEKIITDKILSSDVSLVGYETS